MLEIIKDVLTEYIVDEEMNEEDVDFTARSLAHGMAENSRGSRLNGTPTPNDKKVLGVMKRTSGPPLSLSKKVSWRVR